MQIRLAVDLCSDGDRDMQHETGVRHAALSLIGLELSKLPLVAHTSSNHGQPCRGASLWLRLDGHCSAQREGFGTRGRAESSCLLHF